MQAELALLPARPVLVQADAGQLHLAQLGYSFRRYFLASQDRHGDIPRDQVDDGEHQDGYAKKHQE